jgi:hypothetical protein
MMERGRKLIKGDSGLDIYKGCRRFGFLECLHWKIWLRLKITEVYGVFHEYVNCGAWRAGCRQT